MIKKKEGKDPKITNKQTKKSPFTPTSNTAENLSISQINFQSELQYN